MGSRQYHELSTTAPALRHTHHWSADRHLRRLHRPRRPHLCWRQHPILRLAALCIVVVLLLGIGQHTPWCCVAALQISGPLLLDALVRISLAAAAADGMRVCAIAAVGMVIGGSSKTGQRRCSLTCANTTSSTREMPPTPSPGASTSVYCGNTVRDHCSAATELPVKC
jgi:hypothetical protein